MDNFTDKGLVILPKENTYSGATDIWREHFKLTVSRLPHIFKTNYNISLYYLISNKMVELDMKDYIGIYDITKEDTSFLSNHFPVFIPDRDNKEYLNIKSRAVSKFISKRGMDYNTRYELCNKRSTYIGREISKEFKLVITLERPNNQFYNIKHDKIDSRIILRLDYHNFTIIPYIASEPCSVIDIMNRQWAYKPIYMWEASK